MPVLDDIIQVKKQEVEKLHRDFRRSVFEDSEFFEKHTLSFITGLRKKEGLGIIAEIKKASPSRGLIRSDFNHHTIAEIYFMNEVDAVSILTDVTFFKGSLDYLADIGRIKSVPLLRKDFIIDDFQIYEARANGADMILLIAEVLSAQQIRELTHAAHELDMEVLLEFHSAEQLDKIDFGVNQLIGINNRDLKTFKTDLKTTQIISGLLPADIMLISESGIKTEQDIRLLKSTRTKGILVGEHLMASQDIDRAVKELKLWCSYAD